MVWARVTTKTSSDYGRREGLGTGKLDEASSLAWTGTKEEEAWLTVIYAIIAALPFDSGWKTTWQPKSEIPLTFTKWQVQRLFLTQKMLTAFTQPGYDLTLYVKPGSSSFKSLCYEPYYDLLNVILYG